MEGKHILAIILLLVAFGLMWYAGRFLNEWSLGIGMVLGMAGVYFFLPKKK